MDFLQDERGQDLTEYSLLLAFVAIASAALFITNTSAIQGIWSASNEVVVMANSVARSGTS